MSSVPDTLGLIHPDVAKHLLAFPGFALDESSTPASFLITAPTEPERTANLAHAFAALRPLASSDDALAYLAKWRDEVKPIHSPDGETILCSVERAAAALLGIMHYGSHLLAYRRDADTQELRLWVSKRSATTKAYPGMLDSTAAGGIPSYESPFDTVVREAFEEASLPMDVVAAHAKLASAVTVDVFLAPYITQPGTDFVYDIELSGKEWEGIEPHSNDTEVEWFKLLSMEEIKQEMMAGRVKPTSAAIFLDFMVRHGVLGEVEGDLEPVGERLRSRFIFPWWNAARDAHLIGKDAFSKALVQRKQDQAR